MLHRYWEQFFQILSYNVAVAFMKIYFLINELKFLMAT